MCTYLIVIYLLKCKFEVLSMFREFEAITTSHFNLKIANFFYDNDTEYVNNESYFVMKRDAFMPTG